MTANEKRKAVIERYNIILGRNIYSQPKRNYCYTKYSDGKYYSDCSSSISYAYKTAGYSFGILNTVGMYQSKDMTDVPVVIKNGQIQNPEVLEIGDMLLYAGSDKSRAYAGCVGHVEMVYSIKGDTVTICGHGSGNPSLKNMATYNRSRYNSKTGTIVGHKGLIRVRRFIQNDKEPESKPVEVSKVVTITGGSVYIRKGPDKTHAFYKVVHKGDTFPRVEPGVWKPVKFGGNVRWMHGDYISKANICTGSTVNVRTGPSTSYPSVGIHKKGEKVNVLDPDIWIPILVDGNVYWVSGNMAK